LVVDIPSDIARAFELIITGDPGLYVILFNSLLFSGIAVILAALWGIPIALLISLKEFRGKLLVKTFVNSLIGIPTVVLGLLLFLILSKGGPLGVLGLLYTPSGIILGEAVLVTPVLISIMVTAIEAVDPDIMKLAKTLGASESQASMAVLKEAFNGVLLAVIASFNRAIAELGVALMVGGNIEGLTEVLTTAISRYTSVGEIGLAIALGIILMVIVFIINFVMIIARKVKTLFYGMDIPIFNLGEDKHENRS
jgi:tungstate transport system permease protein